MFISLPHNHMGSVFFIVIANTVYHFIYVCLYLHSLYRGKVGLDVAEAQHLMEGLDWQGAIKDIRASVGWLRANGSQKVCLGSFWVFLLASFVGLLCSV